MLGLQLWAFSYKSLLDQPVSHLYGMFSKIKKANYAEMEPYFQKLTVEVTLLKSNAHVASSEYGILIRSHINWVFLCV